ncbi:MAG TPA: thioredoxin family protein [Bacteroidales bacterium]|nr:thioredoxin family protein [Bacteroidales bacterium]
MEIKILGTGCPKCKQLEQTVNEAVKLLNAEITVSKVEEIDKILGYGVMRTPGLVINEKVVLTGRVPSINEVKEIIEKYK